MALHEVACYVCSIEERVIQDHVFKLKLLLCAKATESGSVGGIKLGRRISKQRRRVPVGRGCDVSVCGGGEKGREGARQDEHHVGHSCCACQVSATVALGCISIRFLLCFCNACCSCPC